MHELKSDRHLDGDDRRKRHSRSVLRNAMDAGLGIVLLKLLVGLACLLAIIR